MSNTNVVKKVSPGLKAFVVKSKELKKKKAKEKVIRGFVDDRTPYVMQANEYEVSCTLYGYNGHVDIDISEYNNARTKKDIASVQKLIKVLEDMIKEAEARFL